MLGDSDLIKRGQLDEFRNFLRRHDMEYDERYIRDYIADGTSNRSRYYYALAGLGNFTLLENPGLRCAYPGLDYFQPVGPMHEADRGPYVGGAVCC